MLENETNKIIGGAGGFTEKGFVANAKTYLRNACKAKPNAESQKQCKAYEEEALKTFATKNNLWIKDLGIQFEGGSEQDVYFTEDTNYVLKANTGLFYQTWTDYLNNLMLHNLFFPATRYELIGFNNSNEQFKCIVKQPVVIADDIIDTNKLQSFLEKLGFKHKRANDYYYPKQNIILEDLHDENVLIYKDIPYFIDTVFYVK